MKIIVEVDWNELTEMNVNTDKLKELIYLQLDEAVYDRGPAIELVGYNIEVILK